MCGTTKVLFLLAVAIIYMCAAQLNKSQTCLCQDGVRSSASKFGIKDVTIYPATTFCNKNGVLCSKVLEGLCFQYKILRSKATSSSDITAVRASATPSTNTTNV
uniref:Chemokine interleukin-8-like domain-containing protein n=1 Tax=Hippocampus comes TaxID=109280 RepID=A0A3Q2Z270_HIPCM